MAQVNATVGDLTGNADKIVEWTRRAGRQVEMHLGIRTGQ